MTRALDRQGLDRQVAEQVMGWKVPGKEYSFGFHPTTDPAAMLQVIERMRALGWNCELDFEEHEWMVHFYGRTGKPLTHWDDYPAYATVGEATCRAALAAQGTGG